jgi:UDPglucose--hexose-1-phosphate uridylyltransferase
MQNLEILNYPHRRKNILTGDWVLVSPKRTARPWQGEVSMPSTEQKPKYDPACYLCPGNKRANGDINPDYKSTYIFTNDFSALQKETPAKGINKKDLMIAKTEKGICRVVNFSPRHDLTLAELSVVEITDVIGAWQKEYEQLGSNENIKYVQIFENKGSIMGNSNPHPHGQIWAQESIPIEPSKELKQFKRYYSKKKRSLLADYLKLELHLDERLVFENASFVVLVPFWATWPYETIIVPKRRFENILKFTNDEKRDFAQVISTVTIKYDNLFKIAFPYSAGLHQAPTDGKQYKGWHFHMHFYPPLLRSASVKKFMVGYEMLAEPQRDITPEYSAKVLRDLPVIHYKNQMKADKVGK